MKRKKFVLCALFGLAIFLVFCLSATLAQTEKDTTRIVFIKAGRLLDVRSGNVMESQGILIRNDRIQEVDNLSKLSPTVPDNATIIDLRDALVLPGLIDCHTHITSNPGDYYESIFRKSPIDVAVTAHLNARRTLEAGFTTVRDLGAGEFIDVALRNAINSGTVSGPRMLVATLGVSATGGPNDITGFSPYLKFGKFSGIADGNDEIRKLIRFEIKNGAEVIKVFATAAVLSESESPGAPQYSQEELNSAVEEAGMWGRRVAAHAHSAEGIKRAVRVGVASIEHGSLIDDEGIQLMKQRGTYFVPTAYVADYVLAESTRLGFPQKILEKARSITLQKTDNFRKVVMAGLKIAFGTDAGTFPHGLNAREFATMVRGGMTPLQAIQAATINAADLLGWQDRIGSLEPKHFADIIAVKADPLKDVSVLENVDFIMKGGEIIKNLDTK